MADPDDTDSSIPLSWIIIFLLLALGLGAVTVQFVGGSLIAGTVLVP
ncbi:hypothetical protein [Halosegnis marinus]|uniref:Sulfite exporter TauE/SafE family protein n=1 Tax=Halosegnis marinus TaxID=3034023 RepID=A0ABD5ZQ92_9EURY|nr:hypothetical protein [Halosegnis sp. DT85]